MKKLLSIAVLGAFISINAQTEKGNWVIAGNSGFSFNNQSVKVSAGSFSTDEPKVNTITFNPSVGYFVMDNLSANIDLDLVNTSTKDDDDKYSSTTFSVLPGATYYFANDSKVMPFLGAGIGYSSVTSKETFNNTTEKDTYDGFTWKAKGGIVFMATGSLGVNLGVAYSQFRNKETYYGEDVKTTVGNLGASVGLSYFIKTAERNKNVIK